MNARALAEALSRLLASPAPGGFVERLVALAVDDTLDQPIGRLVDAELLAQQVVAALSGPGPARVVADHLEPGAALERARVTESGETLAAWVPTSVAVEAAGRLERPSGLPAGWWEGVVDPADVRDLLAGALADTIEDVLGRIGLGGAAGGGAGAGLLGTLARGARAVRDTGSGILGAALGGSFQEGLRRQVRQLAAQSANALKERFRERARTPEGRATVGRIRDRALARLLELRVSDLHAAGDDPGVATLGRWATETLAHNLARPEVRDAIRAQLRAGLERVGERSARSLLDEAGLLPGLRDAVVRTGAERAAAFVATAGFREWLAGALSEALPQESPAGGAVPGAAEGAAPEAAGDASPAPRPARTTRRKTSGGEKGDA